MPATQLAGLLANTDGIGFKLIPHIEEAALDYVVHNTVMASRVAVKTDMTGYNVRKVSEYVRGRRAQNLDEDTDIPDTTMVRARKAHIEPYEVGDRYRITNRRASTDLESIVRDTVQHLGLGLSERVEIDLMNTALSVFRGGELGSGASDYSLDYMVSAASIFRARARHGSLFHVLHPYQATPVMKELISFSTATQQANLTYRDAAATALRTADLRSFQLPTFGITDLSISELLPRRVTFQIKVMGDGGTFRLQLGDGYETSGAAQNITGEITVSTTPATMVTNIDNAIDALPVAVRKGTWVVSGSDIEDLTITPPANVYFPDPDNLRIANKFDEDAVILGQSGVVLQKSSYDLVANPTGVTDMNGTAVGVELNERTGATARSLLFKPDAILWDVREGVQSFFEVTKQGRTAEYSGYMTYGTGQWSPENGMFVVSKAEHPLAV